MNKKIGWFGILVVMFSASLFANSIKIFHLKHRDPESLLPVVNKMMPSLTISALSGAIVAKGNEDEMEILQSLIAQLDTALPSLHIELKKISPHHNLNNQLKTCGKIEETDTLLSCADPIQDETLMQTLREKDWVSQNIQVLNGEIAAIQQGFDLPYLSTVSQGLTTQTDIHYHSINTSFFLQAFLQNKQVQIKLASSQAHLLADHSGKIEKQKLITTLRVPLNSWVNIGGTQKSTNDTSYQTNRPHTGEVNVWLRVEVLDNNATSSASSLDK